MIEMFNNDVEYEVEIEWLTSFKIIFDPMRFWILFFASIKKDLIIYSFNFDSVITFYFCCEIREIYEIKMIPYTNQPSHIPTVILRTFVLKIITKYLLKGIFQDKIFKKIAHISKMKSLTFCPSVP